jgi:hypothetical protein
MRTLVFAVVTSLAAAGLEGQSASANKVGGSSNIRVLAHLPLGGFVRFGDIEIEQEMSRPYVYLPRRYDVAGFAIIDVRDPEKAHVIYSWVVDHPELHDGYGGMQGKYFKLNNRYYYAQSLQFGRSGPDADLGAVITDVTGLPDSTKVKEVGRIRVPENPNGFHNLFTYKHSDGRALLFTTLAGGPYSNIYDMEKFLTGDSRQGLIGRVPIPGSPPGSRWTYHDFYVAYDPATHQDKFYGAAWEAGYFVFDVSRPETPKVITSITGHAGAGDSHTFTPTPDHRYAMVESEYQYAPLKVFDLKPGLDGQVQTVSRPIGAWTADWKALVHNMEVRWPYVFVSGYEDGLQVLNWMDPTNPYLVGHYYTCNCPHQAGATKAQDPLRAGEGGVANGAFGVDVRNADGLIVVSDKMTGFWAFKMDGFNGWNGHQWGMPHMSSAQDWDNGPEGAPKPAKVS